MEKIGRYEIDRVLGSGAFATVWLGHDDELDVDVAIKILAENWAHDDDVRKRFLDEARILWRAQSPHIVRIHHIDVLEDGRPYMVMALADQGSLEDRMRERAVNRRQFTVAESVDISTAIASGLEAAHALDIVHRDLKPSAVLFQSIPGADEPQLVLADFGIAKSIAQSKTTVATGTPHYMAPEQAEGRVDQRTDIYSAAVILYELLAGRVPYAFDSLAEVIRAQAAAPPVSIALLRPDVPAALAAAIGKALSHDPGDRFESATAWKQALLTAMSAEPQVPPVAPVESAPAAAETSMDATMTAEQFQAAHAAAAVPAQASPAAAAPIPATASPPPPPPPPSRRKKRSPMMWPLLGLVGAVVVIVGALVLLTGGEEEGPDITEVFAEPVASTGIDPFTPSLVPSLAAMPAVLPGVDPAVVEEVVNLLNPPIGDLSEIEFPDLGIPGIEVPGIEIPDVDLPDVDTGNIADAADSVVATVSGAAPGLYGGTEILNTCDKEALIAFMEDNLDKATAWAGVQGIDVDEIPDFVRGLTDVILQADTRVTNHGFRNGTANPINSVLQAGTAVLVDTFGIPRVRCYCGNPLQPAVELSVDVTVHGTPWPGFDLDNSVVVQAIEEIIEFTLEDIFGPLQFIKPTGAAPAPPTTTTTVPETTTTTVVLGTGDVQATLRWSGDADLDLHVIDPEGVEIFFEFARSPSGGTLDVDMVPDCGTNNANVENVFWPEGGSIPGVYQAFVVHYSSSCAATSSYELELKINGEIVASDSGTLAVGEASAPISATSG